MKLKKKEPKGWELRIKPNMESLAKLINKAKGDNRTMAEFAEACLTSASTLSRKVNQKAERPIGFGLLERIAEESEGRVTIEELLTANGYRKIRTRPRYGTNEIFDKASRRDSIVTVLSNILVCCGAQVTKVGKYADLSEELSEYYTDFGYPPLGGVVFETNIFPDKEKWVIVPCSYVSEDDDGEDARDKMSMLVTEYHSLFLADQWMPELLEDVRVTIAIADEVMFREFCRFLKAANATFTNEFTVMWVDIEKSEVVEERFFSGWGPDFMERVEAMQLL